jgi:hypothetical protein
VLQQFGGQAGRRVGHLQRQRLVGGRGSQRELRGRAAGEHGDRVLELGARRVEVDGGGLGLRELRLGQRDVGLQRHAGVVLRLRELERLRIGLDRGGVQVALLVGDAQLHVVLRQRRLDAQARGGQVVRARLRTRHARFDRAAHAAPQVGLPASGQAQAVAVARME